MGIISRFTDIMKANINDLLDKCEDPAKMVDQTLRNLNEDLVDVKKETASVMAEEKRCQREVDKYKDEVAKWDSFARKALTAGNESDARTFLAKQQQAQTHLDDANKVLAIAADNAKKVRQMHDKLANDIATLEQRKNTIKAKATVAKTQQSINKMNSASKAAGTMSKFNDIEARVDAKLDAAMAEAELNEEPTDDADKLAAEYANGQYSATVDDALAKLKADMGIQ